ncbi:MAG: hypothetical protein WCI73_15580, partial [Phycisphaerae bacterium]
MTTTALGSYRESGAIGVYEASNSHGDYFSYNLSGLTVGQPYMVEVDYPDNATRTFTVSLLGNNTVDANGNVSYELDAGVTSGGNYTLSNQMQTHQIVFWATRSDPRLLFLNWHSGQRAAVSAIRVYHIDSALPALNGSAPLNRSFGTYTEEIDRFPWFFSNNPSTNDWQAQLTTLDRYAQWSRYTGMNLWTQTIAVYGMDMWPSTTLYGYQSGDEDSSSNGYLIGSGGSGSPNDIMQKDLIRLMLLKAQEYGISFVGELDIPRTGGLGKYLDLQWGGDGVVTNTTGKSWITVKNDGSTADFNGTGSPYYNALDSHVQTWIASVVSELANRYKDSPAFKGLSLRLMSWVFAGWQALGSLDWGYEDSTINQFRAENPALNMPNYTDANRYSERYSWLMANGSNLWINWRCAKITAFYQQLAGILQTARSDLKLYIDAFSPTFDSAAQTGTNLVSMIDTKGWTALLKEAGVDIATLRTDSRIVFNANSSSTPGIRQNYGSAYIKQAAFDESFDPQVVQISATTVTGGTVAKTQFGNEYMENSFTGNVGLGTNTIWLIGDINPAGRGTLERYAYAMAQGNITSVTDGGLGYILGQATYLREFMTEYQSLPNIGMQQLSSASDPVALWYGTQNNKLEFYLVNQADYPVTVTVTLGGTPAVYRLSSGTSVPTVNGAFTVTLQPFQLLAYENQAATTPPTAFAATAPVATVQALNQQLTFVAALLSDLGGLSQLPQAYAQYQAALTAYNGGHYWAARL